MRACFRLSTRVHSLAQGIDILPTLLDAVGVAVPEELRGSPVGSGAAAAVVAEAYFSLPEPEDPITSENVDEVRPIPMVMRTRVLRRFVEPLLSPDLEHVQNIRIGTKAVAYWPQRFVSDEDADDCLRLFEEVIAAGRHLALMGHYSHPVELEPVRCV